MDTESEISRALAAMDDNPRLNIAEAARNFCVPYATLRRRRQGVPPSNSRGGQNQKLTATQNTALKDHIMLLHEIGQPANHEDIRVAANRLLYYSTGDPTQTVSRRWVRRWIARHSEILKYLRPQIQPRNPPSKSGSISPSPSSLPVFGTPPPQPQPEPDWSLFGTPLTMSSRKRGVDYVRKRQCESIDSRIPLTPTVLRISDKIEKATETSMLRGALSTHRLHDMIEAEQARKKGKEESGKVIHNNHQAVDGIEEEEVENSRVVNMRNKRLRKQ